jgi:DNA-binding MarR family transcriptional regulator
MKIEEVVKATGKLDEKTKVIINIMHTSRFLEERVNSLLKQYDLTNQQFNVLRILRGQMGKAANLSTLQVRMIDKNSNTTRLVDKLLNKGLVERHVCEQNRRKIEIFITEEGQYLLKKIDPNIEKLNKALVKNLSLEQMKELNELLDTLRT